MATAFPGAVDNFPRPNSTTNTDDPGYELDVVIDNLSDAVEAVESRLLSPRHVRPNSMHWVFPSSNGWTDFSRLIYNWNKAAFSATKLSIYVSTAQAGATCRLVFYRPNAAGTGLDFVQGSPDLSLATGGWVTDVQSWSLPAGPLFYGVIRTSASIGSAALRFGGTDRFLVPNRDENNAGGYDGTWQTGIGSGWTPPSTVTITDNWEAGNGPSVNAQGVVLT